MRPSRCARASGWKRRRGSRRSRRASHVIVTATVLNRSAAEVTLEGARWKASGTRTCGQARQLGNNQSANVEFSREVPAAQPYSQPYWLVKPPAGDVYTVDDQMLIGLPDTPPAAQVRLRLTVAGAPIELVRPVHYRYADRAEESARAAGGGSGGGGESAGSGGVVPRERRRARCRLR